MNRWLRTFVNEKELDREYMFTVEGESGTNLIPLGCVIEAIEGAPPNEQAAIKNALVRIDFVNGDVMGYFGHLAKAIAL